ncbi:MAG: hypothetical protein Q9220_007312 [cf. Caloplaca sp. 1 TL-2023]
MECLLGGQENIWCYLPARTMAKSKLMAKSSIKPWEHEIDGYDYLYGEREAKIIRNISEEDDNVLYTLGSNVLRGNDEDLEDVEAREPEPEPEHDHDLVIEVKGPLVPSAETDDDFGHFIASIMTMTRIAIYSFHIFLDLDNYELANEPTALRHLLHDPRIPYAIFRQILALITMDDDVLSSIDIDEAILSRERFLHTRDRNSFPD